MGNMKHFPRGKYEGFAHANPEGERVSPENVRFCTVSTAVYGLTTITTVGEGFPLPPNERLALSYGYGCPPTLVGATIGRPKTIPPAPSTRLRMSPNRCRGWIQHFAKRNATSRQRTLRTVSTATDERTPSNFKFSIFHFQFSIFNFQFTCLSDTSVSVYKLNQQKGSKHNDRRNHESRSYAGRPYQERSRNKGS